LDKSDPIPNIVGHALVGCAYGAASGGDCGSGALAAGVGAAVGFANTGNAFGNFVVATVAGGIGAELGGGKFANGAITGAFGYLYNCFSNDCWIGRDAERAMTDYLRTRKDIDFKFGKYYDSEGNFFFGKPDIYDEVNKMVWDVKPDSKYGYTSGAAQMSMYTLQGVYSPGTAEPIFGGAGSMILPGQMGSYEFHYGGNGLLFYQRLYSSELESGFRNGAARSLMGPLPGRRSGSPFGF
jgi:hypothetical protein